MLQLFIYGSDGSYKTCSVTTCFAGGPREAEMDDVKVTVGERTRLRRNALGLTRERLAELIGASPRFLADVESGKVGVSLATLKRMCTALECTADFLIGNDQIGHPDYSRMLLNSELDRLDVRFYPALRALAEELGRIPR